MSFNRIVIKMGRIFNKLNCKWWATNYSFHVGFKNHNLASWNFDPSVIFKSISYSDSKMTKIYLLHFSEITKQFAGIYEKTIFDKRMYL